MSKTLNILVVEDDAVLGPVTRDTLNMTGHRAVLATNLSDAYAQLNRRHSFHAMLLDLRLGDENGETLVNRLREAGVGFPVIVILSAQPRPELERAAKVVNAAGFLQKPSTVTQINEALDRALAA
jgi:DNA-binding NtrC family response regulator